MSESLPYLNAYGVITKTLEKIKVAATPERFTQDFLAVKLGMKGGSARPVIPFLKRIGFLGTDGAPTERYKRFRNPSNTGKAAAEGLRAGYAALYELNEFVHDLPDQDVKGLIVQVTGQEPDSSTVKGMLGSFKALKSAASFEGDEDDSASDEDGREQDQVDRENAIAQTPAVPSSVGMKLGLSYTINLNLPATSDVAVFNAIFKSLREHLLR